MKTYTTLFLIWITCTLCTAGNVPDYYTKDIVLEFTSEKDAYKWSFTSLTFDDWLAIVSEPDWMHPSIIKYSGGMKNFTQVAEAGISQLRKTGVKFLESEFGSPSRIYDAGDEDVVILPRVSIVEMNGIRLKSSGYMICVRTKGKSKWTYLDGSGLRKRPEMLFQLLPNLDKDIKLPKNVIEKIDS